MRGSGERALLWATVAWGVATIWICPEPPLADLPQHAAQISLFRDLLAGTSAWRPLLGVNLFTPYALEYGLGFLFSLAAPVNVAFSLLLTLGYLGFVAACMDLRRELGGDRRLDWLFVPTFFGYSWWFAFIPFSIAAPLAILFIKLARRYVRSPDPRAGARLVAGGVVLFFSHGLMFLFALLVAGVYVAARLRATRRLERALVWPCLALAIPPLLYALARHLDPHHETPLPVEWGGNILTLYGRAKLFFVYPLALISELGFGLITAALMLAPLGLRARLNRRAFGWWVPFATVSAVYFSLPSSGFQFAHLYQRFSLLTVPAYAWLFAAPAPDAPRARGREIAAALAMAVCCWTYFGVRTVQLLRFRRESAAIVARLQALPAGRRVLNLAFDPPSAAMGQEETYRHFAVWYQAYRHGLVDMSFASTTVQVVRYRPEAAPKLNPDADRKPWVFDYAADDGRIYDDIVVHGRSARALAAVDAILRNPICRMQRLDAPDGWTILERGACRR